MGARDSSKRKLNEKARNKKVLAIKTREVIALDDRRINGCVKQYIIDKIMGITLAIGIVFALLSMFQFDRKWYGTGILLAIVAIVGLFIDILNISKKTRNALRIAVCIIGCVLASHIMVGMKRIANQVLQILGQKAGFRFLQFQIADNKGKQNLQILLGLLLIGIGLLYVSNLIVKSKKRYGILLLCSFFVFMSCFHLQPSKEYILLLVAIISIQLNKEMNILFYIPIICIMILGIQGGHLLNQLNPIYQIHQSVTTIWKEYRYDTGKKGMLPEGNLQCIQPLELSENTALKIVMSDPNSYYLRGFVGSSFRDNVWYPLDKKTCYDRYNLFYWLHKDQFSPISQLSWITNQTTTQDLVKAKVKVLYASKQYAYLPYELVWDEEWGDKYIQNLDTTLEWNQLFGQNTYEFLASPNQTKELLTLQTKYKDIAENTEQYQLDEENYQQFARNTYTDIETCDREIIEEALGEENEASGLTCEEITEKVKDFLEKHMIYDTKVKATLGDRSIISYLLQYSGRGYSIHFATIATLLYRYYGVPARYVEGYLITPKDITNHQKYDEITINGYNAHAWVEIYQNGIGWVPIECTPPYYDVMEHPTKLDANGAENLQQEETVPTEQSAIQQQERQDEYVHYPVTKDHNDKRIFWWIGSILLCMGMVSWFIWLWWKNYIRNKRISCKERRIAVKNLYPLIMENLHRGGVEKGIGSLYQYYYEVEKQYSETMAMCYKQSISIIQKAIFSELIISEEEYRIVFDFYSKSKKSNRFRRIRRSSHEDH